MSVNNNYKRQLQKLLEGTLSQRELWELEKASLDDTMLADALEGYRNSKSSPEELAKLKAKITAPAKPKERKLMRRWLSVAASLLVLFGASFWLFQSQQPEKLTTAEVFPQADSSAEVAEESVIESISQTPLVKESIPEIESKKEEAPQEVQRQPAKTKSTPAPTKKEQPLVLKQKKVAPVQESIPATVEEDQGVTFADAAQNSDVAEESTPAKATQESIASSSARKKEKSARRLPTITSGIIRDEAGAPLPGVNILDHDAKVLTSTDDQGTFALDQTNGYVIAAFAGYDSLTLAVTPKVDAKLKQASETFSEPLKRLVDTMDDIELTYHYRNKLNELFREEWPLCSGTFNRNQTNYNSINLNLKIDQTGKLSDVYFFQDIDASCGDKIKSVLSKAEATIFEKGRPVTLMFRVNL